MEKLYLTISRLFLKLILAGTTLIWFSACASNYEQPIHVRWDSYRQGQDQRANGQIEEPFSIPREKRSPLSASLQLTAQGRLLLQNNQIDDAIDVLEQSINLDPSNGESYYLLAEAWLLEGDALQAQKFNQLSSLNARNNPELLIRAAEQENRIRNLQ